MGKAEQGGRFSLRARVQSFRHAWAGGRLLLATQHNARVHAAATIAVTLTALVVGVSLLEWALLAVAMGLVWAMEALNTAIELLADEISPHHRPRIGAAKDVAACAAVFIGCAVFVPRFWP